MTGFGISGVEPSGSSVILLLMSGLVSTEEAIQALHERISSTHYKRYFYCNVFILYLKSCKQIQIVPVPYVP
jgi:hypothetical protein